MHDGNHHRLFLAIRDVFARMVCCPDCGSEPMLPCVGLGGMFVGAQLTFHHLDRIIMSNADLAEQLPFIAS